jgi:uncharacterized protein YjiS (DUF1127 family)
MEAEMRASSRLRFSQIDGRLLSLERQQVLISGHNAGRHPATHVIAALVRWWRAHADRRQRLRAMGALAAMSDRQLKDIGVHRSEIYWAVNHGRRVDHSIVMAGLDTASR